jgi:hypothetical protein
VSRYATLHDLAFSSGTFSLLNLNQSVAPLINAGTFLEKDRLQHRSGNELINRQKT